MLTAILCQRKISMNLTTKFSHSKITAVHLERQAVIYIRQSSPKQVRENIDSQLNQRSLTERAQNLGWHPERIRVFDSDLGQSASQAHSRDDFKSLAAEVALGHVGIVFGWDASRLARNNADWYQLLDLAALFGTLIGDIDGIYDPSQYNDRLLLGLKGTMSESELYMLRQRLNAGRLSKVQRGEYVQHLPTGLVRLSDKKVAKDPNAQVRHVIELIFTKFEELGSCSKVLRYLKQQEILIPRQQTNGLYKGELLWRVPSDAAIRDIITNPAYAGAFVYGRRPIDPTRRKPGRRATGVVRKPIEEWQCIIHDRYPAYISWQQFLRNQSQLKDNAQDFAERCHGGRGAVRKGAALLQGLATCGICGYKMKVTYKHKVRYLCNALSRQFAEPACASLDGPSVEEFVVSNFFKAIEPVQFDALEEAISQQKHERDRLEKYHQQQIKQAEYQAHLARRRYQQVDPDNRLVATALEQEWEEELRGLRNAREAYERFSQQPIEPGITPEIRQRLLQLSERLPELWSTEQLTNEQRKLLLRSLIKKVILKRTEPGYVQVKIVWVSGHFTQGIVNVPAHAEKQLTHYSEMVERVEQLWKEGYLDSQIAQILTSEGFRSARTAQVPSTTVYKIRHKNGWASHLQEHRGSDKVDGMWTVHGLARHLEVDPSWLYRRIYKGLLAEPDLIRRQPCNTYLIRDDARLLELLQSEVQRTCGARVKNLSLKGAFQ